MTEETQIDPPVVGDPPADPPPVADPPPPAATTVTMTPVNEGATSASVGGVANYAAKFGEEIEVAVEHVADMLTHGFKTIEAKIKKAL